MEDNEMEGESGAEPWVAVDVEFAVAGERVSGQIPVPAGSARSDDLLPALRILTDVIVEIGALNAQQQGRAISCRKGCGACCRQLVPLSPPEVRDIRRVIAELPSDRQAIVLERFRRAREALRAAGLLEVIEQPEQFTDDALRPLGILYFQQHIACPFLEDEACSIYSDRPLACREYLVTSPAAHCAQPTPETVRCIDLPAKPSAALLQLHRGSSSRFVPWKPLILAPDVATSPTAEIGVHTGPELLRSFFDRLAQPAPVQPGAGVAPSLPTPDAPGSTYQTSAGAIDSCAERTETLSP